MSAQSTSEDDYTRLVKELASKDKVVFHCTMSQVRGPKAATRYYSALTEQAPESQQEILILHEGFANWQAKFRVRALSHPPLPLISKERRSRGIS